MASAKYATLSNEGLWSYLVLEQQRQVLQAMQPPAAMLVGGTRCWRCLQRYIPGLDSRNDAAMDALLCVEEGVFFFWLVMTPISTTKLHIHTTVPTESPSVTQ